MINAKTPVGRFVLFHGDLEKKSRQQKNKKTENIKAFHKT